MTLKEAADALRVELDAKFKTGTASIGIGDFGPESKQVGELYIYVIKRDASKSIKNTYNQKDFNGYKVNVQYTGQFRPL